MKLNIIQQLDYNKANNSFTKDILVKYYLTFVLLSYSSRYLTKVLKLDDDLYAIKNHIIDSNNTILLYFQDRTVYIDERIKNYPDVYQYIMARALNISYDVLWNNNLNDYLVEHSVDYTEIQKIDYNSVLKNTLYLLYE